MKVGETVFAIGNPHQLGWTQTQGVISQFRTRTIDDRRIRVIQTQAAINQGNSGGGLYDQEGYCLGINTWTADKRVSEGIGFAIALDTLFDLAPPPLGQPRQGTIATMSTVRLRRLQADYEKMRDYVNRHPRLQLIQADGTPPERYQLEYRIRSLRQKDDDLSTVKSHMVEIALPLNYPRMPPQCRMLTPIFHPNIAPHAICIGDHWSPGEPLWSIVARIGEMIAYQSYNTKSPLNGEAARWVDQHVDELPLDPVSMMPDDEPAGAAAATSRRRAPSAPPPPARAVAPPPPIPSPAMPRRPAGRDVAPAPRGRSPFRLPTVRLDRPMAARAGRASSCAARAASRYSDARHDRCREGRRADRRHGRADPRLREIGPDITGRCWRSPAPS